MGEYKLTFLYKRGLDYKTRNFIGFIVILILVVVISVLLNNNLLSVRRKLITNNTELKRELSLLLEELATEDFLKEELADLREQLFLSDKVMPDLNNSTLTLSYIFDIFRKYRNNFYFNYRLIASGQVPDDREVHYNTYLLSGSAYVNLLYVFIDQLERQPAFYTIESLELAKTVPEEQGKVDFSITINAYYTKTGVPHNTVTLKNLRERRLIYNIFYPRIHDPMSIDTEEFRQLLDISEILVVGMTPDRVFIRNRRTGNIELFLEGDKIRYGSLHTIDWDSQEAVFHINPTGLTEVIRLPIEAQ